MYGHAASSGTAGAGGAALASTGVSTLGSIVAATTLLMAGLALTKLVARRRNREE
ncbi:hypothetical protein [Streptomyces boninensis]|uniref:hypothetical protein n=1 Tax=Streptomyces boninensis TaxID=2039455 RepID=UPI003B21069F